MASPPGSGASTHALAPLGSFPATNEAIGMGTSSLVTNGGSAEQHALDDRSFLASDQFRKIQSTAQQALAQCMELGLHVLPIHSAQQRDMLAAKLVEAAYLGVSSAASGRDLGAPLPALSALTHQHPQQLEPYAHNGITSHGPMFESLERDRSTSHGPGSEGVPGPRHASPQGGSEAVDGTRKRRAEAPPESPGSQPKRQQTEQGPAEQLAVSSAAPAGNVASLMTSLEQEVSQDLAQWSETRNAGILDSISAKIQGANAELQSRVAAAEPAQSPAQAASEQQAQAAALAKINAINSRLAQAGVAPHVVPAAAPSLSDALTVKFAAANASFVQAMPAASSCAASSSGLPSLPAPGSSVAAASAAPGAVPDAARLAALDAKLAQFQQAMPPTSGGATSAPARSDSLALLDAKLARYGSVPAGPSKLPVNGLYQSTLHGPSMGYAPGVAPGVFPATSTGMLSGAGLLGAGRPTMTSVPGSWGGQASGAQLAWQQPGGGAMHAHPSAMPGMNASPMPSMPRGALQNGVGLHPMGSPLTPGFRGPPGAVAGSRPMNGPDMKARLQQEALARLQQVNKGWRS